jgi:hypothetical protein
MLDKQIQDIANTNAGRAVEALEIAGIDNQHLKNKIKKLIYYTADDIIKLIEGEGKDGENTGKYITE